MSDDPSWQPPGGYPPPPPPARAPGGGDAAGQPSGGYPGPGYPGPGYPGYPAGSQPGGYPGGGYPGGGWTPPPKPGLIPLRPLGFGTLLGAPFQLIRRNPRVSIGASLLIYGLPQVASTFLLYAGFAILLGRIDMSLSNDRQVITAGAVAGSLLLSLLAGALSTVSGAVLQGIIVSEAARESLGERLTVRELWSRCRGRIGALIGWALLVLAALLVSMVLLLLVVIVLVTLGPVGIAFGVLAGLLGFCAVGVLGFWLGIKLAMVPSVIVLEGAGFRRAMSRSWQLTAGNYWRIFGVIALIAVIVVMVQEIIVTPISLIGTFTSFLSRPTEIGTSSAPLTQSLFSPTMIVGALVSTIVGAILQVARSSAPALLYLDLRMRKEGLDLQLVRFVEARQAGYPAPDPFPVPGKSATGPVPPQAGPRGPFPPQAGPSA